MEDSQRHYCPVCGQSKHPDPRYPRHVCKACAEKITDVNGRSVSYYNTDFGGGCEGVYLGTNNEKYNSDVCYIENVKCIAEEARFGGIAIQVAGPEDEVTEPLIQEEKESQKTWWHHLFRPRFRS